MKRKNKLLIVWTSILTAITLTACSTGDENESKGNEQMKQNETSTDGEHGDSNGHEGMNHSGSGELPAGLQEATNPKYEVGSKANINEDHMPGMKGAEATIVGAYKTTVYALSYNPTDGGKRVENHMWVIHEELENPPETPLKSGETATINAEHMPGMKGAEATIDTAKEMNVYMVDFTPTDGSEKVTNHMWVTEDELSPVK